MTNLLKMQLFRMKRSRLGYFMVGAMMLLSILIYLAVNFVIDVALGDLTADAIRASFEQTASVILEMFLPMLLPVILLNFIGTNHSTGYTKNLVGYLDVPWAVAGSQLLVGILYLAALLLGYLVVTIPASLLITGTVSLEDPSMTLAVICVQSLIALAYAFWWQAVADLTKKPLLGMIFSIIYVAFSELLYTLVDQLVMALNDYAFTFEIERYTLIGNAQQLAISADAESLIRAALIAVLVLVVSFVLDVLACKKRTY